MAWISASSSGKGQHLLCVLPALFCLHLKEGIVISFIFVSPYWMVFCIRCYLVYWRLSYQTITSFFFFFCHCCFIFHSIVYLKNSGSHLIQAIIFPYIHSWYGSIVHCNGYIWIFLCYVYFHNALMCSWNVLIWHFCKRPECSNLQNPIVILTMYCILLIWTRNIFFFRNKWVLHTFPSLSLYFFRKSDFKQKISFYRKLISPRIAT